MGGTVSGKSQFAESVMNIVDEIVDRNNRIRQLEKQCEVLAAEIDCQRPLVDAACKWSNDYDDGADDSLLLTEVTEYYGRKAAREASKPK